MSQTSNEVKRKYNAKVYDVVTLSIPKGDKAVWMSKAESGGKSLTQFIRECVEKQL